MQNIIAETVKGIQDALYTGGKGRRNEYLNARRAQLVQDGMRPFEARKVIATAAALA